MMITENLKKSIRVKASRPLVFEKTSIEIQLLKIQRENLRSVIFRIFWTCSIDNRSLDKMFSTGSLKRNFEYCSFHGRNV